jgi:hypothetical protein
LKITTVTRIAKARSGDNEEQKNHTGI